MFSYLSHLFKLILSLAILGLIGGFGFVVYNQIQAEKYTALNVVNQFVAILENPSKDSLTNQEKTTLGEIVESDTVSSWLNQSENRVKILRKLKGENKVKTEPIQYSGAKNEYSTVILILNPKDQNGLPVQAKLYLQKNGNFWIGEKWKIYQIDMPKQDDLIQDLKDNLKDKGQNLLQNLPNPFNETQK